MLRVIKVWQTDGHIPSNLPFRCLDWIITPSCNDHISSPLSSASTGQDFIKIMMISNQVSLQKYCLIFLVTKNGLNYFKNIVTIFGENFITLS